MSSAARAGTAHRPSRRTTLPILLDIAPPLPLLAGETPDLQVLLAGLQCVEEALRLAPVEGLLELLRSRLPRIATARFLGIRLLVSGRTLLLSALFPRLLVLGGLRLVLLLLASGLRGLVLFRVPA